MTNIVSATTSYLQVETMCAALDRGDVETYMSYFAYDCRYRFGSGETVTGRDAVSAAAAGAVAGLPGLHHDIIDVWEQGDVTIAELAVSVVAAGAGSITLPCVSVMRHRDGRVVDYRIHMDLAPLQDQTNVLAVQQATVLEHLAAEAQQRRQDVYDTFLEGDDAYFDLVPLGTRFEGRAGVVGFYEGLLDAFDLTMYITKQMHSPGTSALEITLEGVHKGEFMGVPASGHPIAFEAAAFFEFDNDRPGVLRCERVYFDVEALMRQIRGEETAHLIGLKNETGASAV